MVMMIGETAGTFKSVVRPLNLNEVSKNLIPLFEGTENTVLRFDLPQDHTLRIGSHYNGEFVVVREEGTSLLIGTHKHEDCIGEVNCFLYKPKGDPQSNELNVDDDAQFICIPKDIIEHYSVGDNISYSLVRETETEERHIRVDHVS